MNKILIVDDSVDLLETMRYVLEHKNYVVKTITTASHINADIQSFQPDLLILDIYISTQDGREICKELRRSAENKDLYILLFSASPKLLENYEIYEANDIMEKPFAVKDLLNKVTSLFDSSLGISKY